MSQYNPHRRQFLSVAMLAGLAGSCAAPAVALAPRQDDTARISGRFCIPIYAQRRFPMPSDTASVLAVLDAASGRIEYHPSAVFNLHGLAEPGTTNPEQLKFGVGHANPEQLEIFDAGFKRMQTRRFEGLTFRGHGLGHPEGVLTTAEITGQEHQGGVLLLLDGAGQELHRAATGGLRPHEIVDCGSFYAIAHYGDRARAYDAPRSTVVINGLELALDFDLVAPSVSFLDKTSLEVVAVHELPLTGAITHLAAAGEGEVLAMGMNALHFNDLNDLYVMAAKDDATLLPSELATLRYERYVPMYRVSCKGGVGVECYEPASTMRRGQSFAMDPQTGICAATYAASQTLFLRVPGKGDRMLNTLNFGVADPRGCTVIPGTGLVAVAGNSDNIAVLDGQSGALVKLYGLPLGGHSHMYWWPST